MNKQKMTVGLEKPRTPRWWRALGVVIVALVFGIAMRATFALAAPAAAPVAAALTQSDPNHGGDVGDDDDYIVRIGVVLTRPEGIAGSWTITGGELMTTTTYTATEATLVEGEPVAGSCVEVKSLADDPLTALKIRAKDAGHCGEDDDHDELVVTYGRVITAPDDGNLGTWVISDSELISFTVNVSTEIKGSPEQGSCVEVKAFASDPTTAIKLREKDGDECGDEDDDDGHGDSTRTLYGLIKSLPDDLHNGIWVIGGFSFVVSPTTELIDNGKVFTPGVIVKVDFTTDMSDTNFATRIEIKFSNDNPCRHHGDDHHGDGPNHSGGDNGHRYGFCPGREGKAIGRIDSLPVGTVIGDWMIGGVSYQTNAYTKFYTRDEFLAGERVRVEYVVLDDQTRLATKIKELGLGSNPNGSLYTGFVDAKPPAFEGTWTIGGEPFEAVSSTVFIEHGSLFAVGSYVVVEYEIANDMRVISRILTYVPPGAGDLNAVGHLQTIGGALAAGVDTPLQTNEEWVVDGVTYIVSEATMLVDGDSELAEGALVSVNSYEFEGQRYATMIRAQAGKAFIPMAVNE